MEFIKKYRVTLVVGLVALCFGYILGGIDQARSFEQELAKNIFNQVTSSHGKLGSK